MFATVERIDGGYVARFKRRLKHPVEKVWAAITSPERVVQWLTAEATIELVEGGKVELRFGNTGHVVIGSVTQVLPPFLLEYTWSSPGAGESVVRWDLQPEDGGCLLTLSHTFFGTTELSKMMAGWHVHLEMLDAAMLENPVPFPWERWKELNETYLKSLKEE